MNSTGANQEAMAVGFEESKGSGDLKFVGSTENVRQFFADDTGGADESEKSFFESFTAAEGIGLEDSTTAKQQQATQPLKIDTSKWNINESILPTFFKFTDRETVVVAPFG